MDLTHKGRQLLGDLPLSELDDELAKDWKQVDELYRMILFGPAPQTIAVSGEWGSGKTSLMKLARKRLTQDTDSDPKGVPTIWFNAWRYENDENLVLPMLATIRQDLLTDGFIEPGGKTAGLLVRLAKASVGAMALNVGVAELSGGEFVDRFFDESGDEPSNAGLHFGFVVELERIVAELPGGRLVIFVDDLDRCLDDGVFRLMEMMKLLFDVPGVVFVVGVAAERVRQAVADHYTEDVASDEATRADHYLEKIFQAWIEVHVDTQRIVANFARVTLCPLASLPAGAGESQSAYQRSLQAFLASLSIWSPRTIALWIDTVDAAVHRFIAHGTIRVDLVEFNKRLLPDARQITLTAHSEEEALAVLYTLVVCEWLLSDKKSIVTEVRLDEFLSIRLTPVLTDQRASYYWRVFENIDNAVYASDSAVWAEIGIEVNSVVMPTILSTYAQPQAGREQRILRP